MIEYNIYPDIIKNNISKLNRYGNVYFAVKANDQRQVLQVVNKTVHGWLVSDYHQFCSLINAGVALDSVIHINVISDEAERQKLYIKGVKRFCFSDLDSLVRFNRLHSDIDPFIRLCINEFEDSASYIGASKNEFIKMIEYLSKDGKSINVQLYFDRKCERRWFQIMQDVCDYLSSLEQTGYTFNELNVGGISSDSIKNLESICVGFNGLNIEAGEPILKNAVNLKTDIKVISNGCLFLEVGIYTGALDVMLYNKHFDIELKDGIPLISAPPPLQEITTR